MRQALLMALISGLFAVGAPSLVRAEPPPADEVEAKELFIRGKHLEASIAYEAMWARKQEPRFLFNAAMSRELSGHELQAFVHLRHYIHLVSTPDEQQEGEERLRALKARARHLRVIIAPATIDPHVLKLSAQKMPDGAPSDMGQPPVTIDGALLSILRVPGYDGAFDLAIEPGTWSLEVSAEGAQSETQQIIIPSTGGSSEVVFQVNREEPSQPAVPVTVHFGPASAVTSGIDVTFDGPAAFRDRVVAPSRTWELSHGEWSLTAKAPRFRPVRLQVIARSHAPPITIHFEPTKRTTPILLGVMGGAGLVSGAIVLGIFSSRNSQQYKEFEENAKSDVSKAEGDFQQLRRSLRDYQYGAGILGCSLGLGVGALTAQYSPKLSHPQRIWAIEGLSGLGIASLSFGLTFSYQVPRYTEAIETRFCELSGTSNEVSGICTGRDIDSPKAPRAELDRAAAGVFFAGLGIGLVVSSVAGLIDHAITTRSIRSRVAVSNLGGRLSISF